MNFSRTNLQTSNAGLTLTELMVSTALATVVGLMMFGMLTGTMKLSSQNAVTNVSNFRARQVLDRVGEAVRYAQATPELVNSSGAVVTGSSDGIQIKRGFRGPYLFRNSNGNLTADIPIGATAFQVEYAPGLGVAKPEVGDFFRMARTSQPDLEVLTVGTPTTSGSLQRVAITTRSSLVEAEKPGSYSVTAERFLKEAYVFAQSGTYWNLRYYPKITATADYTNAAKYKVLGTGFQKLQNQAWFTTTTSGGTQRFVLRAVARSSNRAEYAERISGRTTLTTMPVQVSCWNYNAPPVAP